jgi:chaperonin cofactor prefoldin
VQSEFAELDDDSNIYKLIGPVLLKQDKTEAVMAVSGRLEFIEKEMWVSRPSFARLPFADPLLQQAHREGD